MDNNFKDSEVCTRDRLKDSGVRFAQETGSKTAESGLHKRLVQRQRSQVCTRDWFKDSGVRFAQETGSKTVRFAQETGSKTAESQVCTRDWFKNS